MAIITGNNSGNTLTGTNGADTISGRGGNDALSGLQGDDRLFGELGNDTLVGGLGDDLMDGGAGTDTGSYANLTAPIVARNAAFDAGSGAPGSWRITSATTGTDTLVSVETIVGTRLDDDISGGRSTADLIRGGAGNDFLVGGYASGASDTIYGDDGNDVIIGGEETSTQSGGSFPGTGDRFYGGNGNDRLRGVDGDDRLFGDAGDDLLSGGPDRDVLAGGAGRDKFTFYNIVPDTQDIIIGDFGPDLIADFTRGVDRIVFETGDTYDTSARLQGFAGLDSNRNGVLDDADQWVEVRAVRNGGATRTSTVIDVTDYDQNLPGEQSLTVFGVTGLQAGDFTDNPFG